MHNSANHSFRIQTSRNSRATDGNVSSFRHFADTAVDLGQGHHVEDARCSDSSVASRTETAL